MADAAVANPMTDRTSLLGRSWSGVAMLGVFYLALIAIFSILSSYFLTLRNMLQIGGNVAYIGLMAAAGTPLIIAGGLDLSVAAIAGLTGVVISMLYTAGLPVWIAVALAATVAGAIGAVNGLFTTRLRLNPLIVTLGMMSIVSGISLVLTGGLTRPLALPGFNWIGSGRLAGIPIPFILMLATFLALWVMMSQMRFGRFIYAAGGNPEAARLIGVPLERTLIILYVISAVSGAVAGTVLGAMLGAAGPTAAGSQLLTVIAAIILGGTSLSGGRGSVWGTLVAVLILGTLNNGLTLLDVSSFWQDVTRGVVLMLAVSLDQIRTSALGDEAPVLSGVDFTPIERSSVAEQVARKLLDLVRSGDLKPGNQLPTERELAISMQVSRPSVREAVRGLQLQGVLRVRQGDGIYVTSLDAADLLEPLQLLITLNKENVDALYESRRLIDGGIGRIAARRINDADIGRLKGLLAVQQDLLAEPVGFRLSDMEFHTTIAEVTGNPFLVRVSKSLYVLGMEYRRVAAETPGVLGQSLADHRLIVGALKDRDGSAAEAAMVLHMSNVHSSTVTAMRTGP